jgi:excisionase family DNA binding protein
MGIAAILSPCAKAATFTSLISTIRLTVTIERTADVLDVGRSAVYELLRAGKLKGVKYGRAHRVARDARTPRAILQRAEEYQNAQARR